MPSKLLYTQKALDDLSCLDLFAKKLVDCKMGSYRFRVGDYRAIFDVDKSGKIIILIILTVKHREEAYRA